MSFNNLPAEVNVKDFGATGIGDDPVNQRDDTQAILNAIVYLKSQNKTILYFPEDTYLFNPETAVSFTSDVVIKGAGMNKTLIKTTQANDFFRGDNMCSMEIMDISFEGIKASTGVVINGANMNRFAAQNVKATKCASFSSFGGTVNEVRLLDCVFMNNALSGSSGATRKFLYISRCWCEGNGSSALHHGIYYSVVDNAVIENNVFIRNAGYGAHIYSSTGDKIIKKVILAKNISSNNGQAGSGAGIVVGGEGITESVMCVNNIIEDNVGGISIAKVKNALISGNLIKGSSGIYALYLGKSSENGKNYQVTDNQFIENSSFRCISIAFDPDSTGKTLISNNLMANNVHAISTHSGSIAGKYIVITNNVFDGNTTNVGTDIMAEATNTVVHNY